MGRWTGSWLSGPGAAGVGTPAVDEQWRGQRLGLPAAGPGSVPPMGRRLLAFLVDVLVGGLMGGLVNLDVTQPGPILRSLAANAAFALEVIVLVALSGQSIGMRLLGLRVAGLRPRGVPGFRRALVRTALLMLLVPALIWNRDNRGLHDRAAGTVVLRA